MRLCIFVYFAPLPIRLLFTVLWFVLFKLVSKIDLTNQFPEVKSTHFKFGKWTEAPANSTNMYVHKRYYIEFRLPEFTLWRLSTVYVNAKLFYNMTKKKKLHDMHSQPLCMLSIVSFFFFQSKIEKDNHYKCWHSCMISVWICHS